MNRSSSQIQFLGVICIFIIAFWVLPFRQLADFTMMPGDFGDARLNNYFLENIYQFIQGNSPSLINLRFFYPFPYVLGFSDNLFGASPIYLVSRILTGQPDTAFQIWYLIGYLANFIASYFSLRKLNVSASASGAGALIFTFAFPAITRSMHTQLHFRFGVPLSISMFILFLKTKDWRHFVSATGWLVWQFYCTIYIGFFTFLMLAVLAFIYLLSISITGMKFAKVEITEFIVNWQILPKKLQLTYFVSIITLILLLGLLFYPYFRVTDLFGVKRSFDEIKLMLPRIQSYFMADNSWLWSPLSKKIEGIPMRHEHQMFVGAIPMILAVIGFCIGRRKNLGLSFSLLSKALGTLMLLTIYVSGFSPWSLFAELPLASAIRVMTRIDLVFLFPIAYLCAVAVDTLKTRIKLGDRILFISLIFALLFEFSTLSPILSPKAEWRRRVVNYENAIPRILPQNPILFFAQTRGPFYASELDAMWSSLNRGLPTLNGASGFLPPGYSAEYGNDCRELPNRIRAYLKFKGGNNALNDYRELIRRVVPIGFEDCDPKWLQDPPPFTSSNREYTPNEFKSLSIRYVGKKKKSDRWIVYLKIINQGITPIYAASAIGKPVRISWRFVDASGKPMTGWDTRIDLPADIPAKGSLKVRIPITAEKSEQGRSIEFSIVQETVFWGHDIGLAPLTITWNPE